MSDDSLLGRLADDFIHEVQGGKLPDIESYAVKHPKLAERIRELFPTLLLLEGMAATGDTEPAKPFDRSGLTTGSSFGQYRIEREVGRGGMGIVYEATHVVLEKRVALKVLPVRPTMDAIHLERFFREAKTAAGLHHTNIVPVFDVGQVSGTPYYAMQYIEGRSLDGIMRIMHSRIKQGAPVVSSSDSTCDTTPKTRTSSEQKDPSIGKDNKANRFCVDISARVQAGLPAQLEEYFRWVAGVGIQAAEGLAHAHDRKVIHRDIKPSNLMIDEQGVVWIADFGLARRIEDPGVTQSGTLIGTPRYMSPEQAEAARRPVDQRSDIYSLGATLYELLTCRPVFEGKTPHDVISQIIAKEPVAPRRLNADIPADLSTIVMKAMSKRPEDRYQSASQLADDLNRWLRMEPIKARRIGPVGRTIRWCRRNPGLAAVTATAFVIILVLSGIYYTSLIRENENTRQALERETEALRKTEFERKNAEIAEQKAKDAANVAQKAQRHAEYERDRARLEAEMSQEEAKIFEDLILEDLGLMGNSSSDIIAQRIRNAWNLSRKLITGNNSLLALNAVNLLKMTDFTDTWGSGDKTASLKLKGELEAEAMHLVNRAIASGDTSIFDTADSLIEYLKQDQRRPEHKVIASRLWRDKLALHRKASPPDDPLLKQELKRFADYLENEGRMALDENRNSEAEDLFRELLEVRLEIDPPGSVWTYFPAIAKGFLGESLLKLKRYAEAEPYLRESYEVLDTRESRMRLIALYETWGETAKAEQYRRDLWVESVRELGPIGTLEVRNMDLGFSCYFANRSIWAFRDWLILGNAPGAKAPGRNRWAWTDNLNASEGINLSQPALRNDRSRELINLTSSEQAFNNSHSEQWVLWPGPLVSDPVQNRALVIYNKVRVVPDSPNHYYAGCSLAVWPHPDAAVIRQTLRPESEYPTMLFQGDEPDFCMGAIVDNELLYLYASSCQGLRGCGTIVARAPLSQALDRGAWRFYSGEGNWTSKWKEAIPVLKGAQDLSIHWNKYLGKYLAIYTPGPFGSGVALQMADHPEGEWSGGRLILEGVHLTDDPRNAHALGHPEFARDGGRVEYITYWHPIGEWGGEIRLVEITFK